MSSASKVAQMAREVFLNDKQLRSLVTSGLKKHRTKKDLVSWLYAMFADDVVPGTKSRYTRTTLEYVVAGFSNVGNE